MTDQQLIAQLLGALKLAEPVMDAHAGPSRLADFKSAIAAAEAREGCSCGHDSDCGMHNSETPCACNCTVRKGFERRFDLFNLDRIIDSEGDDVYADDLTQGAWLGWNALLAKGGV
ncbi:hypothetical protein [Aquitalea sp. USM4]|uniref:hypothetical protein n=1 Tax=Aquitalea sp. USM4 TaxID=1590041 RepID=UPI00103F9344|nr:hypothetical protein [Aquitalea sp. USM4]QBJ80553.1 hypothetical protein DKK66_20120 [Aquitalea sp. USM4]